MADGLEIARPAGVGCSTAWGFYINTSLRNLITSGAGQASIRDAP